MGGESESEFLSAGTHGWSSGRGMEISWGVIRTSGSCSLSLVSVSLSWKARTHVRIAETAKSAAPQHRTT